MKAPWLNELAQTHMYMPIHGSVQSQRGTPGDNFQTGNGALTCSWDLVRLGKLSKCGTGGGEGATVHLAETIRDTCAKGLPLDWRTCDEVRL